jgi:hypothetical protein
MKKLYEAFMLFFVPEFNQTADIQFILTTIQTL